MQCALAQIPAKTLKMRGTMAAEDTNQNAAQDPRRTLPSKTTARTRRHNSNANNADLCPVDRKCKNCALGGYSSPAKEFAQRKERFTHQLTIRSQHAEYAAFAKG